jgi:hypothetical protein
VRKSKFAGEKAAQRNQYLRELDDITPTISSDDITTTPPRIVHGPATTAINTYFAIAIADMSLGRRE